MWKRIACTVLLVVSVLYWPFWLSTIIALAGIAVFDRYVEAAVIFLCVDALYGTSEARYHGAALAATTIAVLGLILSIVIKPRLFMEK